MRKKNYTHTRILPASTGFVLRSDPCRRVPRSGLAGPEKVGPECQQQPR